MENLLYFSNSHSFATGVWGAPQVCIHGLGLGLESLGSVQKPWITKNKRSTGLRSKERHVITVN